MGRPDLTVQTLWTIPLIYNLVLIAHAQMPLINAHVYVSKVRYSMGYFDSENTGGITSESALFSMTIQIKIEKEVCNIEFSCKGNKDPTSTSIHR